MGCDIHMIAERRDKNGVWKLVGTTTPRDEYGEQWVDMPVVYDARNYNLFAILANVRNGYGFAGCDTGDGYVPIAAPRGVPGDACPEYKAWVERLGVDGHSHSWFTVAELEAYDWSQATTRRGLVNGRELATWDGVNAPRSYCGGVSGPGVQHVSVEHLRTAIQHNNPNLNNMYASIAWAETYATSCREFLADAMPKLREIGPPNDVRICFFFDN